MALYDYYNTGSNSVLTPQGASTWYAQTFTASADYTLTSVKMLMYRANSPGTITLEIWAVDGSGHPTGGSLASGTTDGNTLTTDTAGEWREITLGSPYGVSNTTKYALVVKAPSADSTHKVYWRSHNGGTYPGGNAERTTDAGSSWTTFSAYDNMFETYGSAATTYVDAATTITGEVTFTVSSDVKEYIDAATTITAEVTMPVIAGTAVSWRKIALEGMSTTFEELTLGTPLSVANGGTGGVTLTDHGILLGSGTSAVTPLGAATNGQLPIGSTGADPVLATLTGTTNQLTVTNGAGTITLSLPQDIHTGASPTLADLTISAPVNIYALSHDSFANFVANEHIDHTSVSITGAGVLLGQGGDISASRTITLNHSDIDHDQTTNFDANEHFLQTAITNVSTGLSTGILTVTTGTGALGVTTNNTSNWDAAYSHKTTEDAISGLVFCDGAGAYSAKVIGVDVQAYSANLSTMAGLSSADSNIIVGSAGGWVVESGATARTSLGLGTGDVVQFTALRLNAAAAVTGIMQSNGSLVDNASVYGIYQGPTLGSNTGDVFGTDQNVAVSTISTGHHYYGYRSDVSSFTVSGTNSIYNFYTAGPASVTGSLASSYGLYIAQQKTSGVSTGYGVYQASGDDVNYFAGAITHGANAGIPIATAGLWTYTAAASDSQILVATGANTYAWESGATLRTSIGLGTGDTPTFTSIDLSGITDSYIPYMSASGLANSSITYTGTKYVLTGTSGNALEIVGSGANCMRMVRVDSDTTTARDIFSFEHETDGDMADGFGMKMLFRITDATFGPSSLGHFGMIRAGDDSTGAFVFQGPAGDAAEWVRIDVTGIGVGTSPSEDIHAADTVRADTAFNLNGTDGASGTIDLTTATSITVSGGIITAWS